MSVVVEAPSRADVADGVETQFVIGFSYTDPAQVTVAVNGVLAAQGVGDDYIVAGDLAVFTLAPPAGASVVIARRTPIEQDRHFATSDSVRPGTVEGGLDERARVDAELRDGLDRTIQLPVGEHGPLVIPPEDERAGNFFFWDENGDPAVLAPGPLPGGTDAALVSYLPTWPGAQRRSTRSRLMDRMSIFDFIHPSKHALIQAGTADLDDVDCSDAWDLAKAAATLPGRGADNAGEPLYYPLGIFPHSRRNVLDKTMSILGAGGMTPGAPASEWLFPRNVGGLWIPPYHANAGGGYTPGGDGSTVEGITLRHLDDGLVGGDDPTVHGVLVQAKCDLRRLGILFFPGAGLKVTAFTSTPFPDPRFGNANVSHFQLIDIQGRLIGDACYSEYGYHCEGMDANVISSMAINAINFNRWCFYERSGAGNTHMGAHVAYGGRNAMCSFGGLKYYSIKDDNLGHQPDTSPTWWTPSTALNQSGIFEWDPLHTYQTGGPYKGNEGALNGFNLFLGCYDEGGMPPSVASVASVFIGGAHPCGFDEFQSGSGAALLRGITGGPGLTSSRPIGFLNFLPGGTSQSFYTTVGAGFAAGAMDGAMLTTMHAVEAPSVYRFTISAHNLKYQYANSTSFQPYQITGPLSTDQFGTGFNVLHQFWVTSIAIGITTNARRIYMSNVMPTTGTYAKGDRVFNMFPGIVGGAGVQYTVSGWLRMVTGTAHVLNVDWVEMRCPTGT